MVCTGGINPLGETQVIGVFVDVVDFNFMVKRRGKVVAGRVRLRNASSAPLRFQFLHQLDTVAADDDDTVAAAPTLAPAPMSRAR